MDKKIKRIENDWKNIYPIILQKNDLYISNKMKKIFEERIDEIKNSSNRKKKELSEKISSVKDIFSDNSKFYNICKRSIKYYENKEYYKAKNEIDSIFDEISLSGLFDNINTDYNNEMCVIVTLYNCILKYNIFEKNNKKYLFNALLNRIEETNATFYSSKFNKEKMYKFFYDFFNYSQDLMDFDDYLNEEIFSLYSFTEYDTWLTYKRYIDRFISPANRQKAHSIRNKFIHDILLKGNINYHNIEYYRSRIMNLI